MAQQEIFTLSGAHVGADADLPQPASPPAVLQNALRALGTTTGDPQLSVRVDGVVGAATVKAVNWALSHYVGATQSFPHANLTLAQVRQNAAGLAAIISDRVRKSGGSIPPVQMQKAVARSVSALPAAFGPPASDGSDTPRWVWWAVGGAGLLVILTVAVGVGKKKK